jgi:hypothetical protein
LRFYTSFPALEDVDEEVDLTADTVKQLVKAEMKGGASMLDTELLKVCEVSSPKMQKLLKDLDRAKTLKGTYESAGNARVKTVVFAHSPFTAYVIYHILESLEYKVGFMHSEMDATERTTLVTGKFQGETPPAKSEIDIIVGVYSTMGTSWTMTRARQCILFELDYEESKLHQAEFRIRRIGQKYKTKFIRYHLKKSIENYSENISKHQ